MSSGDTLAGEARQRCDASDRKPPREEQATRVAEIGEQFHGTVQADRDGRMIRNRTTSPALRRPSIRLRDLLPQDLRCWGMESSKDVTGSWPTLGRRG